MWLSQRAPDSLSIFCHQRDRSRTAPWVLWSAHVAWCLAISNLIFKTPPTDRLIELSLNDLDEKGSVGIMILPVYLQSRWWLHGVFFFSELSGFSFLLCYIYSYQVIRYHQPDVVPGMLSFFITDIDLLKSCITCLFWAVLLLFLFLSHSSESQFWQREQGIKATPKSFIFPQNHLFPAVPDSLCPCAVYLRRCAGWDDLSGCKSATSARGGKQKCGHALIKTEPRPGCLIYFLHTVAQ